MYRISISLILLLVSIGLYISFISPEIGVIKELQAKQQGYDRTIDRADKLLATISTLNKEYNDIPEEKRDKLEKMIPQHIDNVRLIIEINRIALSQSLKLESISLTEGGVSVQDSEKIITSSPQSTVTQRISDTTKEARMKFSVIASYDNFKEFVKLLESNLRLLTIQRISVEPSEGEFFRFTVEFSTYWLGK